VDKFGWVVNSFRSPTVCQCGESALAESALALLAASLKLKLSRSLPVARDACTVLSRCDWLVQPRTASSVWQVCEALMHRAIAPHPQTRLEGDAQLSSLDAESALLLLLLPLPSLSLPVVAAAARPLAALPPPPCFIRFFMAARLSPCSPGCCCCCCCC
jgi:hypothetical protein